MLHVKILSSMGLNCTELYMVVVFFFFTQYQLAFQWLSGEKSTCQCRSHRRCRFNPWVRKIPWKREWQPIPVFLTGKSYGQRNLAGYSPWGCKESDTTKQLSTHTHTHTQSMVVESMDTKLWMLKKASW